MISLMITSAAHADIAAVRAIKPTKIGTRRKKRRYFKRVREVERLNLHAKTIKAVHRNDFRILPLQFAPAVAAVCDRRRTEPIDTGRNSCSLASIHIQTATKEIVTKTSDAQSSDWRAKCLASHGL